MGEINSESGRNWNIVNMAFALVFGAVAVAAAIAFGIGGRDAAKQLVEDFVERRKYQRQF